ncbi:ferredoxin [Methylobacterium sp.]|jgi:ferredoxin|uniref:ferredoxin n=1 Tax=Methylobacterium sp. TaxID=409 RepID=UPI0026030302|nr:ferredoxin [Methylobacterium sp.]MDB5646635.1 ferredoxin [Methylobacterium sp.]
MSERPPSVEPNPDPQPSGGPLRVTVDLNLCQAYAQCCYAAPDHFVLNGREALHYDPAPSAAARADIERARIACPVQAIHVEDAGTAHR